MADELENLSEEQLINLMAGGKAEETPAPAPKEEEKPPEQTEPPSGPELPSWLAEIPEADRVGVAERYLESMTPEQRLQLPSVMQLVNAASEYATQQTQQQINEASSDQARSDEMVASANELYDDIMNARLAPDDLTERLSEYAEVAGDTRQADIVAAAQDAIWEQARLLGLSQIPGDVAAKAGDADDWGGAMQVYNQFFIGTAYNRGLEAGKKQAEDGGKADTAAEKARMRDEIIADLRAEGRLKENVPPSLGDTVGVGSGQVQVSPTSSEDELLAAMAADLAQRKR